MGITAHSFGQTLLEGLYSVTLVFVHMKSCRNKECLGDKCFSHLCTPVQLLREVDVQVGFGKLQILS